MNNTNLWDKCLEAFCDNLSEKQMKTWIHPLEVSCNSDTLSVIAPNKFIKDTVENDFCASFLSVSSRKFLIALRVVLC